MKLPFASRTRRKSSATFNFVLPSKATAPETSNQFPMRLTESCRSANPNAACVTRNLTPSGHSTVTSFRPKTAFNSSRHPSVVTCQRVSSSRLSSKNESFSMSDSKAAFSFLRLRATCTGFPSTLTARYSRPFPGSQTTAAPAAGRTTARTAKPSPAGGICSVIRLSPFCFARASEFFSSSLITGMRIERRSKIVVSIGSASFGRFPAFLKVSRNFRFSSEISITATLPSSGTLTAHSAKTFAFSMLV